MRRAITVILTVLLSGLASGAVLTVDCEGGADYGSIQAAVAAAGVGDTLLIAPCVYEEHVDASEKGLTFIGSGDDVTRLQWGGAQPALRVVETGPRTTYVRDMTLAHTASGQAARWSGRLGLDTCTVVGLLDGDGYLHPQESVSLSAADCTVQDVELWGAGTSHMTACQFLTTHIVGHFDYEGGASQDVIMTSCSGDTVHVWAVGRLLSNASSCDGVRLHGGLHSMPAVQAEDSFLGHVVLTDECWMLRLIECELASLSFDAPDFGWCNPFRVLGCTVRGPMLLNTPGLDARIVHNTILGDFEYLGTWWGWPGQFQSNIVSGATTIMADHPLVVSHNDLVGGAFIVADGDSVTANISEPPLFCDEPEDLTLQDCSPCVGSAHDGSDIGAFPVGCDCIVVVERRSWGAIKGLYR